jgi:hypothetical protein
LFYQQRQQAMAEQQQQPEQGAPGIVMPDGTAARQ